MNKLITLKFNKYSLVGKWCLQEGKVQLALYKGKNHVNVPYAFVVNEEVIYEGKSDLPLFQSLYFYQNPKKEQNVEWEIHDKLIEVLKQGNEVEIYVQLVNENKTNQFQP